MGVAVAVGPRRGGVGVVDLVNVGEVDVGVGDQPADVVGIGRQGIAGLPRRLGDRVAELIDGRGDHRLVVGAGDGETMLRVVEVSLAAPLSSCTCDGVGDGERLAFAQEVERVVGHRVGPGRAVGVLIDGAEGQIGRRNDRRIGHAMGVAVAVGPRRGGVVWLIWSTSVRSTSV